MYPTALRHLLLACLFLLATARLQAAPPLAPSDGTFNHTHYGIASGSSVPANKRHSWYLTWRDNASDEQGYSVFVRYGSTGPFANFGNLAANSTAHVITIPNIDTPISIPVQFKIEAWKYNGTATESSSLTMSTAMPKPAAANLATPSGLTVNMLDRDSSSVTNLSDGIVELTWTDNSNCEFNNEIQIREVKTGMTDADWKSLGTVPFNSKAPMKIVVSNYFDSAQDKWVINFVPGKQYQFRVRALRDTNITNWCPWGVIVPVPDGSPAGTLPTVQYQSLQIPALNTPTNLNAVPIGENQVRLTWTDTSDNETGYSIESRYITTGTPPAFTEFGSVGANITDVIVPASQLATAEFQVRAQLVYTPTGGSETKLYSPYSNIFRSEDTSFAGPSDLTATPSPGLASTIDLTWKDNSETESGFDILARRAGTSDALKFARAVRAGVTSVSVDSIAGTVGSDGRPTATDFVKLTPGTAYEFVVRAVGDTESIVSASSNTVTATPRPGFTMPRLYHPAKVGEPFQYHLTTSPGVARSAWNAAPLPPGLSFNSSTGLISGTPTTAGIYEIPLTATLAGPITASCVLTLRIVGLPQLPVLGASIPDVTVGLNAPLYIDLEDKFTDPGMERAVRMETNRGNLDLELFPSLAPQAVANFLAYVDAGDYDNLAFHRLAYNANGTPFVLQGGNMRVSSAPKSFASVGRRPSPINEPGISNLRGTISAAKVGERSSVFSDGTFNISRDINYGYVGLPNSATTDFFLNPVNNAGNLDNQNGGFTAFGRLTESSLLILDQICSLPRASYQDGRTTTNTSDQLDKRILIDGTKVPISDFPMNVGTVPADMDNSKAVRVIKASSIPAFAYTLNATDADKATVTVENTRLKITGLAAGSRTVQVTARDLDGNTIQQDFTITVNPSFQPPVITKHPVSATVNVGARTALSVTATGTNLTYQWRRNGATISGETGPVLDFDSAQAGDSGVYDVVVTTSGYSVTSSAATLAVRVPADITSSLPNELLIEVGQPLDLSLNVSGVPAPTFTWKRGNTVLNNQTTRRLQISSMTLADAGLYTASATNGSTDKSNSCQVLVVDKSRRVVPAAPGKAVKLTAPAAGPFVSYSWRKNGNPINQPGITGMDKAILSISKAQSDVDTADYTCVLTPPGSLPVVTSGILRLAVSGVPQLSVPTPPVGYIGLGYTYTIPYSASDTNAPASFTVTGLPPGLTLNKTTGVISGRPTKGGIYTITIRASNPAGTSPAVTGTMRIQPAETAGAGTYVAIVNPALGINDNKGGRLNLTITDNTLWTASLQLGKDTYKLKGNITATNSNVAGASSVVYAAAIGFVDKARQPLALYFEIDLSTGDLIGLITSETESVDVNGYRHVWHPVRNGCFFTGLYNIGLTHPVDQTAQPDVPQGDGYMTLSVLSSGNGTMAGRLADGTTITGSAPVGRAGQSILFQMLYKNTGSLLARMGVTSGRNSNNANATLEFCAINGNARWIKGTQLASERNYQQGFAATSLNLRGWAYQAPDATITPIVMGLPTVNNNVGLSFNHGGLATASPDPNITFTLNNANVADFTGGANPANVSFKVTPATGVYTGTFELEDSGIKRRVTFQGLIIPATKEIVGLSEFTASDKSYAYATQRGQAGTAAYGAGYFLLDKLPVPPATKSTSLLSGRARLAPAGISITTQPVSQTVNPGANVTFTCAVNPQSGLRAAITPVPPATTYVSSSITYQWRQDGINIPNATTSTLTLNSVQEAAQGQYDCLVKEVTIYSKTANGATDPDAIKVTTNATTTQAATLTINDPVSDIIVLQNPSRSTVPSGSVVTFTAENKGTEPFTYQWRRNGTDIDGATGISYTTPPVGNDQAGDYTVLIKNAISTNGVLSPSKTLAHATPTTAVTITRTPSSNSVASGSNVIFSATSNGTNPSYQWLKNDVPITAATSSTFSISTVSLADVGLYKVQAINGASQNTITSNELSLNIVTDPQNIVITKSFSGDAVPVNTQVTLTVAATGTAPLTYQWRKNEVELPGETATTLTFNSGSSENLNNPDRYDVVVYNPLVTEGVHSSQLTVRVGQPVSNVQLTSSPEPNDLKQNDNVTLSASASGNNLEYEWLKDGSVISGQTSSTYTISSFDSSKEGRYAVRVRNPINTVTSTAIELKLNSAVTAATLTLTSPGNSVVTPGTPLTFSISVSGGFGHHFQWRRNDEDIGTGASTSLNTNAPMTEGTYTYNVDVTNSITTSPLRSTSVIITVQAPPP